jgi:ribosomal protein S25
MGDDEEMKMYSDLTVEGTPEEVAAFKHIDAALAARNKRSQLAIEAKKPAKKPAKKAAPKKAPQNRQTAELYEQILAVANDKGVNASIISQYFEISTKTAYNMLYRLKTKGLIYKTDDGLFRATRKSMAE